MHRRCPREHGFGERCARRVRRVAGPSAWVGADHHRQLPLECRAVPHGVAPAHAGVGQSSGLLGRSRRSWSSTAGIAIPIRRSRWRRSVRSFLRFAHATGRTSVALWGAVPVSAGWHLASLPRSVPAADLERLLAVAARWRFTATDRRDYAILLLLARLGLRRGEVAALFLDDIDWRAGELTVVGKGDRVERLPLPAEPGEAIAAWLVDGRPECQTRSVFTTLRPPGRPLSSGAIGHIVGSACRAAGLDRIGAHRLRHTLASAMLRAGASLSEVGQVLRHRSASVHRDLRQGR